MDDKEEQPATIRHYRHLAKAIVQHHFGKPPSRILYKASGRTNYVFAVNHVEGQFVIRMSPEPERLNEFRKELWVSQKVREEGVPSPEVLAVGNDVSSEPYMITRRVTGAEASHHPRRDRIIHEMGRYAAIINSILTNGFGANFDWTTREENHVTWAGYLEHEFQLERRLHVLSENNLLDDRKLAELSGIVRDAVPRWGQPSLNHSDLRLKNVIVDEGGDIAAIVDWEECLSTVAPQWELSTALHELSIDEKQAFIDGYGLSAGEMEEMAPLIKAFNILNYSQAVELAVNKNDHTALGGIRLRLKGCFDLYSLSD